MLANRHFDNVLNAGDGGQRRPGSAPPQMDDLPGSPLAAASEYQNIFLPGTGQMPQMGDASEGSAIFDGATEDRYRSDPAYVKYYYANKNINPRLPPPITSREQASNMWVNKGSNLPEAFPGNGQLLQDSNESQAAHLAFLMSNHLGLKETTPPIPIEDASSNPATSYLGHQAQDNLLSSSPWASAANGNTDGLESLLQHYNSPKHSTLSPLLSGDLTKDLGKPGASSLYAVHSAQQEDFSESLFNAGSGVASAVGSAPHTPRGSSNNLFETGVNSPRAGTFNNQPSLGLGLAKDPKLSNFGGGTPSRAIGEPRHRSTPSKLRIGSTNADAPLDLPGTPTDLQANISDAFNLPNLGPGLQPGSEPGVDVNSVNASAAGGLSQGFPPGTNLPLPGADGLPGFLGGPPGVPSPQQMQAMYMAAAMYPYYQQGMNFQAAAAMQAATGYPGFPMMPGMGYPGMPGYPMMPGMLPGMMGGMMGGQLPGGAPPFPMPPGGFPPGVMPPFPGMPGMGPGGLPATPAEYAQYYQKLMEAQAAAMGAPMGGSGGGSTGSGGGKDQDAGKDGHGTRSSRGERADRDRHERDRDDRGSPVRGQDGGRGDHGSMHGNQKRNQPRDGRDMDRGSNRANSRDNRRDNQQGGRESGGGGNGRSQRGRRDDSHASSAERRVDALLEEFKTNKNRKFEFKDILGHIFEFSLDQHGSRFIQQKLETVSSDDLALAFTEVLPRALTLMTDVFGNYVVQKFFEHATTTDNKARLAVMLKGHVLQLSLQMYGCRVIQKALEVLDVEAQCEIIAELDGHVMRCVRDQNGNHVIQKCIECVDTERIAPLLDNFLTCVVPLSTHPFGCRVIQRILEHCQDLKKKATVMEEILKATCQLAQDQYGNYVIQHVLEHGRPEERIQVIQQLAPKIVEMSMHKFASNVVEKCLTHCSAAERDMLLGEMLKPAGDEASEDPLQQMMKDQFGNYVVQKVLEVCDDVQREALLSRVRAQLHALKKFTYGKHIVARVEKLLTTGNKIQIQNSSRMSGNIRINNGGLAMGHGGLPDDSTLAPIAPGILGAAAAARAASASCDGSTQPTEPADKAFVVAEVGGKAEVVAAAAGEAEGAKPQSAVVVAEAVGVEA